ncbi:MAG: GNAT family N-acetyltransferase [Melioribacteraceae bacterium]|jgi:ribosomal protein S18 acetylase RimI-like enzyme|nr:GNAT family N-acetyltransferase [Melioribacteraceae bacterium]
MNDIVIKEIKEISVQLNSDINSLLKQLTPKDINFSMDEFRSLVNSSQSILLGAFSDGKLVGILTLVIIQIPTGISGRIEDVVVDSECRGKGVGELLSLKAIEFAKELKLKKLFLTSNPKREEANKLYQKLGFILGDTNSYFYEIINNEVN